MSLSAPFNLLADFPGWTVSFDLMYRQEQSRTAGGRTVVKDLGSPLWQLKAQSKQLRPNTLDYWRARLAALENGLQTFYGYPLSRTYPIAYPNGSWPTGGAFSGSAVLATINANRKAVTLSGLPAAFALSVGDYVSIAGDLHQVMEAATASAGGLTPEFEVRPHIWPSVTAGAAAAVYRPSCIMSIVPGSVASDSDLTGWGSLSFQAIEARE